MHERTDGSQRKRHPLRHLIKKSSSNLKLTSYCQSNQFSLETMSSSSYHASIAASGQDAPLLRSRQSSNSDGSGSSVGSFAVLLGRVTGRRGTSMVVRETAARELAERRVDWGYSKPVVALDIMWNMAFVVVSVVILIRAANEKPNTPLRPWIIVYAVQCLVHAVLVWIKFRRRNARRARDLERQQRPQLDGAIANDSDDEDGGERSQSIITKRCESVNTMVSFIWWMLGFYWIVSGGDVLLQNAPCLYWLAVVFLAFDVFFAIFCVVLACLIGIALCCCLPCIIAILYAVAGQEGASDADLSMLPKYRYQVLHEPSTGAGLMVPVETSRRYLMTERVLLHEDAECCICLSQYEDGAELHALPCNHHFHHACITKWLKMNATCPLCKYNILKGCEPV